MVLHTSPDYRSYACGKRERQRGEKDCTQARRVNARKADKAVLDAVLNRILSPAFIEELLDEIQRQMTDTSKIDRAIEDAHKILDSTKRSSQRLMELAEKTGDLEDIAKRLVELKREEAAITQQIKTLKAQRTIEIPQITPEALSLVFSTWRDHLENYFQNGDILNAKKLLAQFVNKIELSRNTAIIHYRHPLEIPAENMGYVRAHKIYRQKACNKNTTSLFRGCVF